MAACPARSEAMGGTAGSIDLGPCRRSAEVANDVAADSDGLLPSKGIGEDLAPLTRGARGVAARHVGSVLAVLKVPGHADSLMLPTRPTDTARNVGGIRTMLEVVPTGCRQCGLKLL
jgi:hypothetical protein